MIDGGMMGYNGWLGMLKCTQQWNSPNIWTGLQNSVHPIERIIEYTVVACE